MPFSKQAILNEELILDNNNDDIKQNEQSNKKSTAKLLLIFIVVFIIVFAGIIIAFQLYNSYNIQAEPTTAQSQVSADESNSLVENPIDFDTLIQGNDEIYAWIVIDDTNVNYPIVQNASDDSFYLKHKAEDKSWSASGAVYTELVNKKDFSDPITVVYGHNGYSTTMFTTLHKFEDSSFFNEHPYFYIYTPDSKLTYQIISAFKYDDRHIMNSFDFKDSQVLLEFQDYILNPESSALKNVRKQLDTEIDENSKIVILSTCITNQKSSRYLICGVQTKNEKTN